MAEAIARVERDAVERLDRLGGDADVRLATAKHLENTLGAGLSHLERDVRMALDETLEHRRQHVARMRMRARDDQPRFRRRRGFARLALQALAVLEHLPHGR